MKMQSSIETKIKQEWQPIYLEVVNESHLHSSGLGAESHFKVLIVSNLFANLSRVQRQQKVYQLLAQELKSGVHALSLRLLTDEEWKQGAGDGFQSPSCHSKIQSSKKGVV
ncbi:BolA family transcriptional regulator [bacterium]|nr:BolA family transcriptional regulator [bacterium]